MRKKLLAAIIASELPKPCITLDLFKSDDRLRAYGGMRCPGRVRLAMNYQQFTDAAHKMSHNEKVMVWMDESSEISEKLWITPVTIAEVWGTPVIVNSENMRLETRRKESEK